MKVTPPVDSAPPPVTVALNVTELPSGAGFMLEVKDMLGTSLNTAVTVVAEITFTTQGLAVLHPPPDQLVNTHPGLAVAASVTVAPESKWPVQITPQAIPTGEESTVPEPVLVIDTE